MSDARKVTNDVISAVEDGFLDWETVAKACLTYMSEDNVIDMVHDNEWAIGSADQDNEEVLEEAEDDNPLFNADHAQEWLEAHPYGWYNNEEDYGYEEGDEKIQCGHSEEA